MTTTIVQTQPASLLTMNNLPAADRYPKRMAASSYDEDGDFQFTRASKRPRSDPEQAIPSHVPSQPPSQSYSHTNSQSQAQSSSHAPSQQSQVPSPLRDPFKQKPKRLPSSSPSPFRKAKPKAPPVSSLADPSQESAQFVFSSSRKVLRTPPRGQPAAHSSHGSTVTTSTTHKEPPAVALTDVEKRPTNPQSTQNAPVPNTQRTQSTQTQSQLQLQNSSHAQSPVSPRTNTTTVPIHSGDSPRTTTPPRPASSTAATSPWSAKKNRRSSVGMRGRRASTLIQMGHTATPHREVNPSDFYKHIADDGAPEPDRMRQLLTWCGERALLEKPSLGSTANHAVLGARAIQDLLLKDIQKRATLTNWFATEDDDDENSPSSSHANTKNKKAKDTTLLANPRNLEHRKKIAELEAQVKRLREQKEMWLTLEQSQMPLVKFLDADVGGEGSRRTKTKKGGLITAHLPFEAPDADLLDPKEAEMLQSLTSTTVPDVASTETSAEAPSPSQGHTGAPNPETINYLYLRSMALSRLRTVRPNLEFQVDTLADSAHKLSGRVATAGREADAVLQRSATLLRQRQQRDLQRTGTSQVPMMEVLRSLGRILPEEGQG